MNQISIAFEHEIEYYLFKPIIKQLILNNYQIKILTSERTKKRIKEDWESRKIKYYATRFSIRLILLKALHKIVLILLTPHNFSSQYQRMILQIYIHKKNIWSIFYRLSFITPKSKNINKRIGSVFKYFTPKFFETKKVLVPTLNSYSFLLSRNDLEVYTVMESWDHAMKVPNGYVSKKVFLWNEALQNDWKEYQKDLNTFSIFPLKLRYAINNKVDLINKSKKIVYAVALTELYSNPFLEKIEKQIIEDLCRITQKMEYDFFIKPRPISSETEFNVFLEKYNHVSLGSFNLPEKNPSNYFLDDAYNKKRFDEIHDAMLVVNCFTTFSLDSALYGIPVLQLDLSKTHPETNIFYNNHHIKKYLISSKNILKIENNFKNEFTRYFYSNCNKHFSFMNELQNWIGSKESLEDSINKMLKEINQ